MALQTSGQISLSNVAGEKGVSLSNVSLVSLSTTSINTDPCNPTNPNNGAPHSIAEFYGYDHSCFTPPALNEFSISGVFRDPVGACAVGGKGEIFRVFSGCGALGIGCQVFSDDAGNEAFRGGFWYFDLTQGIPIYIDEGGFIQETSGCK